MKLTLRFATLFLIVLFTSLGILSPLFRAIVAANFWFSVTFLGVMALPALVMREWYGRQTPVWFWLLATLSMGIYYLLFTSPNPIGTLATATGFYPILLDPIKEIWGYLAWLGWSVFFYTIYNSLPDVKEMAEQERLSIVVFTLDCLGYLVYMNLAVQILYPRFGRG